MERQERTRVSRQARYRAALERPRGFISRLDPSTEVYPLGELGQECEFCGAFFFQAERSTSGPYTTCCVQGDGQLEPPRPVPRALRTLLESQDGRARAFRRDIYRYNSIPAFISISYSKDE